MEPVMKKMKHRNARGKGFTLIEVLLVLVILVILAGLAVVNLGGAGESAKVQAARVQCSNLESAVEMFKMDQNDFPPSLEALLSPNLAGEPYVTKLPLNPWKQPYQYEVVQGRAQHLYHLPERRSDRQFSAVGWKAMRTRSAFTLVELLLVLCLLVIAGAMAWPRLAGVVAGQRLRSGADQVRVEWCRARVQAMSKGQIVLFRFVPNGNQFRLENRASDESVDQDPTDGASASGSAAAASRPRQLPRGVQFAGGQVAADSRALQAENDQNQPSVSDDGGSWSDPIFFYPDGTTSTARVALTNEYHRRMEISLRGLTGVAHVQEVSEGSQR